MPLKLLALIDRTVQLARFQIYKVLSRFLRDFDIRLEPADCQWKRANYFMNFVDEVFVLVERKSSKAEPGRYLTLL